MGCIIKLYSWGGRLIIVRFDELGVEECRSGDDKIGARWLQKRSPDTATLSPFKLRPG